MTGLDKDFIVLVHRVTQRFAWGSFPSGYTHRQFLDTFGHAEHAIRFGRPARGRLLRPVRYRLTKQIINRTPARWASSSVPQAVADPEVQSEFSMQTWFSDSVGGWSKPSNFEFPIFEKRRVATRTDLWFRIRFRERKRPFCISASLGFLRCCSLRLPDRHSICRNPVAKRCERSSTHSNRLRGTERSV